MKRARVEECSPPRGWARRQDFLNELSDLRRAVVELRDRVAADYLTHAVACFAKGRDQAGEVWLRLAVERLRGVGAGAVVSVLAGCLSEFGHHRSRQLARLAPPAGCHDISRLQALVTGSKGLHLPA